MVVIASNHRMQHVLMPCNFFPTTGMVNLACDHRCNFLQEAYSQSRKTSDEPATHSEKLFAILDHSRILRFLRHIDRPSLRSCGMSATASGSSASQPNGSAKHRQHTDGSEDRRYTPEQKAEVIRVRKCSPTAFYEILAIEKTASDGQIKKAYRKISLLTHPDKNGYSGSDEAFKSELFHTDWTRGFVLTGYSGVKGVSDIV